MTRFGAGPAVEGALPRRRNDEADLFAAGLAAGLPSPAPAAIADAGIAGVAAAAATANPHDDEVWVEVTEDDVAAEALAGTMFTAAVAGAKWARDDVQPDYAHLGPGLATGKSFTLTAADLQLLATLNSFDAGTIADAPVLFGLRGCAI